MHRQSCVRTTHTHTRYRIRIASRVPIAAPVRSAGDQHACICENKRIPCCCLSRSVVVTRHTMVWIVCLSVARRSLWLGLTTSSPDNKSCMHEHDESEWQLLASYRWTWIRSPAFCCHLRQQRWSPLESRVQCSAGGCCVLSGHSTTSARSWCRAARRL